MRFKFNWWFGLLLLKQFYLFLEADQLLHDIRFKLFAHFLFAWHILNKFTGFILGERSELCYSLKQMSHVNQCLQILHNLVSYITSFRLFSQITTFAPVFSVVTELVQIFIYLSQQVLNRGCDFTVWFKWIVFKHLDQLSQPFFDFDCMLFALHLCANFIWSLLSFLNNVFDVLRIHLLDL